jgi:hypothetical protein
VCERSMKIAKFVYNLILVCICWWCSRPLARRDFASQKAPALWSTQTTL